MSHLLFQQGFGLVHLPVLLEQRHHPIEQLRRRPLLLTQARERRLRTLEQPRTELIQQLVAEAVPPAIGALFDHPFDESLVLNLRRLGELPPAAVRLAVERVLHARHVVDERLLQSVGRVVAHRHLELGVLRGERAVEVVETPRAPQHRRVLPRVEQQQRAPNLLDAALEDRAPPQRPRLGRAVEVGAQRLEPHEDFLRLWLRHRPRVDEVERLKGWWTVRE